MITRAAPPVARRALRPAHLGLACAAALSALLMLLRWHQDWNGSEGTYALTARALLHGGDLYGNVVVAHPPGLFVVGAGLLALGDGLDQLRAAMVLLQLGSLALIAVAVARMTGSRWAAAATPPLGVLLPWSVHEQGLLLPEAVALPCLAGALVLAPRPRGCGWAGALLAAAVAIKLPMALPALLGLAAAADRRRAASAFAATGALLVGASLAVFGTGVLEDTVLAQLDVGRHDLHAMTGLGAQAAWNLAPLSLGALAALTARRGGWRTADEHQWRVAAALALGTTLTLASTLKVGTSLAILAPIEAMLLPVAMTGAVAWCAEDGAAAAGRAAMHRATVARRVHARHVPARRVPARRVPARRVPARRVPARRVPGRGALARRASIAGAAVVLLLAQSASLLAEPTRGGRLFLRPFSAPAWGMRMSGSEVDARVAALRRCPRGMASGEGPVVTFRAGRRMPGDQPDIFLPARSARLAAVARRVAAERRRCPR